MDGVLLNPGAYIKALARPYNSSLTRNSWTVYPFCSHDGKIYRFNPPDDWTSEDYAETEDWTPSHWTEIRLLDYLHTQLTGVNQRIDQLDPDQGSAIFTDLNVSIGTSDWTANNGVYTYTYSSPVITERSGIDIIYDSSCRTALTGDIDVAKATGSATFVTNGAPIGTLTCVIRVFDSVQGVVPIAKGGTGQSTLAGAQSALGITALSDQIVPQTISSTSDFDSYITPGTRFCGVRIDTMMNKPTNETTAYPFYLEVENMDSYTFQKLYVYRGDKETYQYTRQKVWASGGTSTWGSWYSINNHLADFVICSNVSLGSTGSVSAGGYKALFKALSEVVPSGYQVLAVTPGYTGNSTFAWCNSGWNSNEGIYGTVINTSSSAQTGTPNINVIMVRDNL